MNSARKQRLLMVIIIVAGAGLATFLATQALDENLAFYFSPTEITAGKAPYDRQFRAGGLVVEGSIKRSETDLTVIFDVTDGEEDITVQYTGILPDLFREGQGIIALGKLNTDNIFIASEVLAKHDETYMPPEVADSLEKADERRGKDKTGE